MTFAMCSSWRPSVRGLLAGGLARLMVFGIVAPRVSPEGVTGAAAGLLRHIAGIAAGRGCRRSLWAGAWLPRSRDQCYGGCRPCVFSQSLFCPTVERLAARRPRLRRLDSMIVRDGWKLGCMLRISPIMPFAATSYMPGLSSIGLRDYAVGTLASLPALCGYVFIGTLLADAGLSSWTTGADPVRWTLLLAASRRWFLPFARGRSP